jgi:hypothetical protein
MGRQHLRAGFIQVRQQKTDVVLEIPPHPALHEILTAHHPAEHLTLLTTAAGKPFTAAGLYGLVSRPLPGSWLAAWAIGAWSAQGNLSTPRRGRLFGQSNRGDLRPRLPGGTPKPPIKNGWRRMLWRPSRTSLATPSIGLPKTPRK